MTAHALPCVQEHRVTALESAVGPVDGERPITLRLQRLELYAQAIAVLLVPVAVSALTWLVLLPWRHAFASLVN